MRNKVLIISLAAAVSGAISGLLIMDTLQFGPGLFFGLATAPLLVWAYRPRIIMALLWVGASTGSWYLALRFYSSGYANSLSGDESTQAMIGAGLIGAALLGLSFWLLISRISPLRLGGIVLTGGICAYGMILIMSTHYLDDQTRFALAFALWQAGVAFALTFPLGESKPTQ